MDYLIFFYSTFIQLTVSFNSWKLTVQRLLSSSKSAIETKNFFANIIYKKKMFDLSNVIDSDQLVSY